MPSENYLVTFTTAANLAGVDALKASFLDLNAQTILLAAAIFAVYEVGKAGVENFKKQEVATNVLTQAYETQKETLAAHRAEIDRFLAVNARFIKDQYDTQAALANLIRAGYDTVTAFRILGVALDRTAVKGGEVTESQKMILLAMMGNKRAIKEIGISAQEYDKIQNDKTLPSAEKQRRILQLIEERYAKGRDTIGEVDQKQSELNKHWQDFTARTGPAVLGVWGKLIEAADTLVQLLDLTVQLLEKLSQLQGQATSHHPGDPIAGPAGISPRGTGSATGHHTTTVNIHLHAPILDGPTLDHFTNQIVQRLKIMPAL